MGVNVHEHRQTQRKAFYAFNLFLSFSACDGCWRQTGWPWRTAEGLQWLWPGTLSVSPELQGGT